MNNINSMESLREAILQLETKRLVEAGLLKSQLSVVYESTKPINIIRNTFNEILGSDCFKNTIISSSIGLVTGLISKLIFERRTHDSAKKNIGQALMFSIAKFIANNPEVLSLIENEIVKLFKYIKNLRNKPTAEP